MRDESSVKPLSPTIPYSISLFPFKTKSKPRFSFNRHFLPSSSMAPKRKNESKSENAAANQTTTRVTRSSTRQATQGTTKPVAEPVPKAKKAKLAPKQKPEVKAKTTEAPPAVKGGNASKTIVIEHCKQCTQFKIRAEKVKLGLEKAVSGITVLVNPEKPRRGCFEVREEDGKKFISLLEMKRPFAPMKALDMDTVISDIVDQVK